MAQICADEGTADAQDGDGPRSWHPEPDGARLVRVEVWPEGVAADRKVLAGPMAGLS